MTAAARLALLALLVGAAALWAPPVWAGATGVLRGRVMTPKEEPVARAKVTITSPRLLGVSRTTLTDERGLFRFADLLPARYDVRIERPGYVPRLETGVIIDIDRIVEHPYTLTPLTDADGEKVEATEAREEGVHPRQVATGRSIRPSLTDKLVTPRNARGMAFLVPGVVEDFYRPGSPSIHGAPATANGHWLDGYYITDPAQQIENGAVNFDSVLETLVLTGGLDAEYGYSGGGVINSVTSPGQDTFDFDGSLYWSPAPLRLQTDDEPTQVNRLAGNLAASGPILPGRLWFFTAVSGLDDTRTTPLEDPVFLEVPFMYPRQKRDVSMLGKLTWRPLAWQTFSLLLQTEPSWLTNERQEPLRHPRAERQVYTGGLKTGFTSETHLLEHVTWRTLVSYGLDQVESTPLSGVDTEAGHINIDTGTLTGNDTTLGNNFRYRVMVDSSVATWAADLLGQHEVKAGVQAQLSWNVIQEGLTGVDYVPLDDGGPFSLTGFNSLLGLGEPLEPTGGHVFLDRADPLDPGGPGQPYRVLRADSRLEKLVASNILSLYLQDVWNPWPNLTVRAGLRFDSARAYIDADDGGDLLYNFNWPSPRVGMSWDPFGDGKTAIRGGYFHYADMGNLSHPARVGRTLELETYEYNPATKEYDIFVGREGGQARVLPGSNLGPPLMHELLLGVSREVFKDASVHVDLVFRQRTNLFEDRESNIQWNADGSDATGFGNGRAEPLRTLETPGQATQRYLALDVSFDKRLSDRWSLFASYTLSQLEGSVEGGVGYAFDNPRQAPYEFGFLRNDVRHNARVFLTYDLPYGVTVGVSAQYQSGRPYSKLFYNAYYGDYVDRRAPRGYDPGDLDDPDDDTELRLPDQFLVNARLSWRLQELTTQDLWLILEVQNVLNQRPTTMVEERALAIEAATSFGQSLSRVDPLRATLGLRYRF